MSGPLARTVADAWLVYLVLRGDPTAALWPLPARLSIKGLRLGVPRRYFHDLLDDEVRARFAATLAWLRQAGAETLDVVIPHAGAGPSSTFIRPCRRRRQVTPGPLPSRPNATRRMSAFGSRWAAICWLRITSRAEGRAVLRREVDAALDGCDALVLPTLPIPAPPVGATTVDVAGTQQPVRAMMLRMTQVFSLTGHPAISLPMGETSAGLPCGLQLVGRRTKPRPARAASACETHVIS